MQNQQKMSSNWRNVVLYKQIRVKESNANVRIFTKSRYIAVSVHTQYKYWYSAVKISKVYRAKLIKQHILLLKTL